MYTKGWKGVKDPSERFLINYSIDLLMKVLSLNK